MKELLQSTLRTATWPEPREREKVKGWIKEIGERVKKRMLGAHCDLSVVSRDWPNVHIFGSLESPIECTQYLDVLGSMNVYTYSTLTHLRVFVI